MAVQYVDLACTKAALVRSDTPDTNYHGADRYQLDGQNAVSYGTYLLLEFESLPETYHYRHIVGASLEFTCDRNIPLTVSMTPAFEWDTLKSGFDEATVTWNNMPEEKDHFYKTKSATYGTGDEALSITAYLTSNSSDGPKAAYTALKSPAFKLSCTVSRLYGSSYANVYTNAAASGKRPVLRIAMSDTNASVSVDEKPVNGKTNSAARFACNEQSTFTWDIALVSGYAYADVVQDSATLYWRRKGTTGWNTVPISGSEQSYTFQENVLPAADIEWTVIPVCGDYNVIASTDYKVTAYPRYFAELQMTGAAITRMDNPDENVSWDPSRANQIYHYTTSPFVYEHAAFLMFSPMPAALGRRAIDAAAIKHDHFVASGWKSYPQIYSLSSDFDPARITWNNAPQVVDEIGYAIVNNPGTSGIILSDVFLPDDFSRFPDSPNVSGSYRRNGAAATSAKDISFASRDLVRAPALKIAMPLGNYDLKTYQGGIRGTPAPVLVVMLFDENVTSTVVGSTQTAGWVNPQEAQEFSWEHVPDGDYASAAGWQTTSATLYWSSDNGSTWNSVPAPANSESVTLPANTLPAGTIKWYVTATDDQGTTSTSPTYTITTEDSETTATPISPVNTVEDGSAPIRFLWETANNHGTEQTAADLEKSTDGTTWVTLGTVTGSEKSFTAPADTFLNGSAYWRVRAYNADGVAGPWSAAASFTAVNAPPAPVVSASEVPFSAVTWQSEGQEAWRITVDEATYGPYFGGIKRFEIPTYLENGSHKITVEVQGSSGKWSKPGETIVQIQNVPGDPVTLSGSFERDAELSWETVSQTADFLIYRDGVRIGHTSGMEFADRTVLGGHSWQVINRLPSGNYTASNIVQGMLSTEELAIALLSGGGWLELTKSRNPTRQETYSLSQNVSLTHFAGQEYPEAETSPYKTLQGNFDVSWNRDEPEQAAAFEAMIGKPIIYKATSGETLVGILAAIQKNPINFFKAYTATVQRINWRDFVDEDN